ncbi:MAG: type III secretion system outer membrane ring subunit SctC [Pseudomonadota bacterium]
MRARLLVWLVLALALCPSSLLAQWSTRPFTYIAVDQDVRELLRDFAASEGLGVIISDQVRGVISGDFREVQPQAFMQQIAATSGLTWYLFAGVLYVYDSSETVSEIIHLANTPPDLLRRSLMGLGILDPRFDFQADPDLGIVLITGPPKYTDLVKQVIQTVEARRAAAPGVAVIKLKYASATDRIIEYRDQLVRVPGVTSILQRLLYRQTGSGVTRQQLPSTVAPVQGALNENLSRQSYGASAAPTQEAAVPSATQGGAASTFGGAGGQTGTTTGGFGGGSTGAQTGGSAAAVTDSGRRGASAFGFNVGDISIESDPRLNAVIIGASKDRLPFFERLIAELDKPSRLIQIDVTIIDVSANRLSEIGVQWEIGAAEVASAIVPGIGSGLAISGMTSIGGIDFAADVAALEQVGDATIVAQPSVLTFDSVEAIIDEAESIYIRVEGDRAVDLYQVETGTLLRVTPRIIEAPDGPDIEMFIDIRDGDFDTSASVDDIPAVAESTLTTTAVVGDSQGLLLGGLYRTQTTNVDEKVPLLGDIPVLGLAFRSKRVQQSSVVRLFLLTPQVVELGATSGPRVDLTPPGSTEGFSGGGAQQGSISRTRGEPLPLIPSQPGASGAAGGGTATRPATPINRAPLSAPVQTNPSATTGGATVPPVTAAPTMGLSATPSPATPGPAVPGQPTGAAASPTAERRVVLPSEPVRLAPLRAPTTDPPPVPSAACETGPAGSASGTLTYESAAQRFGCLSDLY